MAGTSTPHLATRRSHGQEQERQCKLAPIYLTIYLGLLTRFTVPLRPRPQSRADAYTDGTLVLVGGDTDVTACEDVEIAAFSAPVVEGSGERYNTLTPAKR